MALAAEPECTGRRRLRRIFWALIRQQPPSESRVRRHRRLEAVKIGARKFSRGRWSAVLARRRGFCLPAATASPSGDVKRPRSPGASGKSPRQITGRGGTGQPSGPVFQVTHVPTYAAIDREARAFPPQQEVAVPSDQGWYW